MMMIPVEGGVMVMKHFRGRGPGYKVGEALLYETVFIVSE
jgi:hypothetical protein